MKRYKFPLILTLLIFYSTALSATSNPKIYWSHRGSSNVFGQCNLDGTDVQFHSISNAQDVRRFTLHEKLGSNFWGDTSEGIIRTNMSGTKSTLISSLPDGTTRGVAVDPSEGKIYWVGAGIIQRMDMDSQNVEVLYTDLPFALEGLALNLRDRDRRKIAGRIFLFIHAEGRPSRKHRSAFECF